MAEPALVLGLDVGGTSSRALLADASGHRRGTGRSGGGNPTALGAAPAARAIEAAVRRALGPADPARVAAVVVGLAGGGRLASAPGAAEEFGALWDRAGITAPVTYVGDAVAAFVAGTPAAGGSLLLAGTGAIAVRIRDRGIAARADGNGWLLGDLGSGFWLGRRAVLAVLAELEGTGPATALTPAMAAALFPDGMAPRELEEHEMPAPAGPAQSSLDSRTLTTPYDQLPASGALTGPDGPDAAPVRGTDVVLAVTTMDPAGVARLAPLVTAACAAGDEVARGIADRAAGHLLATLGRIRAADDGSPVVLAGSVLIQDTPVAAAVRAGIAERWPDAPVGLGLDGAAGAAWLALGTLAGGVPDGARELLFRPDDAASAEAAHGG